MEKIKVLSETIHSKGGVITKFIKLGNRTFKLQYECSNGTNKLSAMIMNSDGEFIFILNRYDVGDKFEFVASYVSDIISKQRDAVKGFKLLEEMILKLYC